MTNTEAHVVLRVEGSRVRLAWFPNKWREMPACRLEPPLVRMSHVAHAGSYSCPRKKRDRKYARRFTANLELEVTVL